VREDLTPAFSAWCSALSLSRTSCLVLPKTLRRIRFPSGPGACQVATSSAGSQRCLRSCMRAVVRPCCCTFCCTDLTLTRQGNSVRLPPATPTLVALAYSSRSRVQAQTASAAAYLAWDRPSVGCPLAFTASPSDRAAGRPWLTREHFGRCPVASIQQRHSCIIMYRAFHTEKPEELKHGWRS
jgi:hypothetical protein